MILRFADCELDTDRLELRRCGEVRHCEPQVYDLLVHLVLNRDRLVTRDELLDAIWGHRFVTPSTLSSRIKALRQAVGDDGTSQQIVRTVRGRGFRFVAEVQKAESTEPEGEQAEPLAASSSASPAEPRAGAATDHDALPAPQQIRFCQAHDGVTIAYAISGAGPPLVKTANWLSHLEHDWASPVWRHWLTELSRRHTLVRYDERGCGLSDRDVAHLSFDDWVRDLETLVDRLELERFPLLGVSQGGAVAIEYAARHPDRVTHLILYGAYAMGRTSRGDADSELLEQMLPLGWGRDNPAFRHFFARLFIPEGTEEQIAWFNDLQRNSCSPEQGLRLFQEFGRVDVTKVAPRIRVPTLVLHASADAAVPFQWGRDLAGRIPGAAFVPLWGKNHILLESEPAWDRFVEELRSFLGEEEPASTSG